MSIADRAAEEFRRMFSEGGPPDEMPEAVVPSCCWIVHLLCVAGLAQSGNEARRMVAQQGVRIDGERITDPDLEVVVADGMVLQFGKRRWRRLRPSQKKIEDFA